MFPDVGGDGGGQPVRGSFPRALGAAFLVAAALAAVLGILESALSDRYVPAGLDDLLYGANLHVLLAAVVCLALGLTALRAPARSLGARILSGLLAVEGGLLGGYWVGTLPAFPRFVLTSGKLLTGAVALAGALLGLLAGRFLARRLSAARWDRLAQGAAGRVGCAVLLALLVVNAALVLASRPRAVKAAVRADAAQHDRPDVIVILVDTLRRDHLDYFGYERPTSPDLDRLFDQSYVFTQAYTPSTWTVPSVASLFTGIYPSSHGITTGIHKLSQELPTLAEHFRTYGYRTGAMIGNQILVSRNGFLQGFDSFFPADPPFWCRVMRTAFERVAQQLTRPSSARSGGRLNVEARAWLERTAGEPRFLYIHYIEPHSAYEPHPRYRDAVAPGVPQGPVNPPMFQDYRHELGGRDCNDWECVENPPTLTPQDLAGMVASYDGEVRRTDAYVGTLVRFLGELGMLDRCHIIFCADHGEEFFDHRGWFHGNSIYEEMTGCPLAYRPPGGLPAPVRIARPVAQLDLIRTLFTILGMESMPMHQGREIPELLGAAPPAPAPPVLSELPPYLFSLRQGDWKIVQRGPTDSPEWRLFNLRSDPGEQENLASAHPDTLRMMRGWLQDIVATHARSLVRPGVITDDPEMLRNLRNLGYIR